jgi:hypothetical protein
MVNAQHAQHASCKPLCMSLSPSLPTLPSLFCPQHSKMPKLDAILPALPIQGVAGSGRGTAPTPTRQWFGRLADSSNQSPAMFRISPLTGPERPRGRQTGSYGSMGPPPQQHPQQQLLQLQHQRRPYGGRQAAEVQRTSRPLQSYAATAAGGRGGAAAATAAAAGRGRVPLAAPTAAAGAAAAADGVWRRSASPPLQQVAQRLFGADIADESGHTTAAPIAAAGTTADARRTAGLFSSTVAAGWTGPSGLAAAAAAAGAGTSQLTPPARFDAALNTTLAELGGAAAVNRDSALHQKEAAALARAAKAQAMLDKAMQRSKVSSNQGLTSLCQQCIVDCCSWCWTALHSR